MFLENQKSEVLLTFDDRNKAMVKTLFDNFPLPADPLTSNDTLDLTATYPNHVFLLQLGIVKSELDERELCCYDEGDLVGIPHCLGMSDAHLISSGCIEIYPIEYQVLKSFIAERIERLDIWHQLLASEIARMEVAIGFLHKAGQRKPFGFRNFKSGDVIIQEGSTADDVYAIIEGEADVMSQGLKVGDVLENEIFGAMAFLTNTLRTATVVARKPCLVMVVPQGQFQGLLESRPDICLNLMKNMARQIISLNQQVRGLSDKTHGP